MAKRAWIIVASDMVGQDFTGPFETRKAALAYAKLHRMDKDFVVSIRMLIKPVPSSHSQEVAPPADVIRRIAEVATAVGFQANVGASEIAGQIVSCLYANPEHIQRFMEEGTELFIDGTFDPKNGSLSYMAMSGKITSPSTLRRTKGAEQ